jgi:ADP-ribose pyrophosphatase
MDDAQLIEHMVGSEPVYDGTLLKVRRDQVRLHDGHQTVREWIAHPGAVVIIAALDNGKLLFERQFRYPLRRIFTRTARRQDRPGEHPLDTARRELREETGHRRNSGVISAPCTPASAIPTSASKSSGPRA